MPKYRSRAEGNFGKALQTNGIKFEYETGRIKYTVTRTYTPDFYLLDFGFYVEYKGYFKSSDRRKHILVKEQNPTYDIRFVFQNANNKLNKKSKTTYGAWADKHGFLWSEGRMPKEWLKLLPRNPL
jgi:hypothetical protein